MLKYLRNAKTKKRIFTVLAVVIIPAFAIWGVSVSNEESKLAASSLGKISGHKVSMQTYLKSYKATQHEAILRYGDRLKEIGKYLDYKGEAWDRLLLLEHARKTKLKSSDAEVIAWITSQPLFVHNGRFEDNYYNLFVKNYLHIGARDFEEEIREVLTIQKVRESLRAGIHPSDEEIKALYDQKNAEKDILYGTVEWTSEKSNVKISDDEVTNVFKVVQNQLTAPPSVKVRFLFVPSNADEKTKAAVADTASTLDELSNKYALNVKETPYFSQNDTVSAFGTSKELYAPCFALQAGGESPWIKLEAGNYKIALVDKKPERPLTLEESKDKLRDLLAQKGATDLAVKKLQELRSKMEGNDLEKTLIAGAIPVSRAERFKKGAVLGTAGSSETLDAAVAELNEGDVSQVLAVPAGAVIIKVTKAWPGELDQFNENKTKFREELIDKKTGEAFGKLVKQLREKLEINLEVMRKLFPAETTPA